MFRDHKARLLLTCLNYDIDYFETAENSVY